MGMLGINWLFDKCEPLIERVCKKVSSRLPDRLITTDGDPYLHRFYLHKKPREGFRQYLPSVYLHYFHRGDLDKALHNHPWKYSLSLVLTNGYLEDRRTKYGVIRRLLRSGSVNFIRANDYHKVTLLDPSKGSWTLFVSGPRVQDWCFWDPARPGKQPVPWRIYLKKEAWLTN